MSKQDNGFIKDMLDKVKQQTKGIRAEGLAVVDTLREGVPRPVRTIIQRRIERRRRRPRD